MKNPSVWSTCGNVVRVSSISSSGRPRTWRSFSSALIVHVE